MRHASCLPIALLVLVTTSGTAQSAHQWFGPFVGMNYAGVYGTDASGLNSRTDLAIGGQVDSDIGEKGFFRTGVIYSRRGFESGDAFATADLKISYLELPLLFGYHIPTAGGGFQPFILGGGQFGIRLWCSLEESSGGRTASSACNNSGVSTDFAGLDFAIVGEGGLAIPLGLNHLLVDIRYAQGMVKIERHTDIKNRGFTFGLGFMMPAGN